jgi:hypothetical protein
MVFWVYGAGGHVNAEFTFAAATILPSARRDGVLISRAEAHLFTTVGVSNVLAANDQLRLMDRASVKWGL